MNHQLPLAISLNPQTNLSSFCWQGNVLLQKQVEALLQKQSESFLYIWGHPGCGKSHLLQGICQAFQQNQSAVYLPLQNLLEWGPVSIEGMQESELITLDDIDAVAGHNDWQEALFHFYNQVRDSGNKTLLISGSCPPAQLPLRLADLRSRLSWGLVMQLHELSDEMKVDVIRQEAQQRGFALAESVAQFLVNRCARNLHDLKNIINQLDKASLAAKRRITVPFVKMILRV